VVGWCSLGVDFNLAPSSLGAVSMSGRQSAFRFAGLTAGITMHQAMLLCAGSTYQVSASLRRSSKNLCCSATLSAGDIPFSQTHIVGGAWLKLEATYTAQEESVPLAVPISYYRSSATIPIRFMDEVAVTLEQDRLGKQR